MSDTPRSPVVNYVVAFLSAATAILLKGSLNSLIPNSSPYLLGLAAVMVAAWYGGMGPGMLTTILVAIASNFIYVEPGWNFLFGTPGDVLHFSLFLVEGVLISSLSAMLHRSRRRAERKAAEARMHEETLRLSEERFRLAAECASDLIYEIDLKTGAIEWFGDIDGRLGYAAGEFPRTAVARLGMIHPEDRERVREMMDRHLATREPFEMEYRVVRRDGALLYWTDRARAARDTAGGALKWIGVNSDITERKHAEESLTESESRYRNLVETSPDAVVLLSDTFTILMVNERTVKLHGYDAAGDMIGREAREFVAVIPWENAVEKIGRALEAPSDHGEEMYLLRKDGSSYPAEIRASAIRGGDGTPHAYIAVITDVTDRRRIEKRLREQTEVVETVNRIGQLLSAELDQQRLVQALTDAATELTGAHFGSFFYNMQDNSGEWYMMYSLSGVGPEMFAHFPMPRNTDIFGPTFRGEGVLRLDDVREDPRYGRNSPYYGMPPGHLPVVSYLAVPVVSRMGEVFGGLFFGHPEPGMFTDRHERIITGLAAQAAIAIDNARLFEEVHRVRANVEASERHYRILTEAIPSMVWTALPDGQTDYFNQQWYDYTGLAPETTLGWGWISALHPDDVQYCRDLWTQVMETGGSYEIEYRFLREADRTYRWHLGRAIPVRDEQGNILQWFGTCTDIDDQKRAQETLKFLAGASTLLGSGNNYRDALQRVASMAVPIIADWCVIDLAEPDGSISRVAVAHDGGKEIEIAHRLIQEFPPARDSSSGVTWVIRTGAPEFYNNIGDDDLRAVTASREHFEMLRGLGLRSGMCLPLLARGRAIGAITLFYSDSGRRYTDEEIVLAQDLARRVAFSVDNAWLYLAAQEEIGERSRAEVELRVAKDAAEEANRAKDHFLAVLSHELRTPLTPVLASVQALEGEDGVPEDLRPLIEIIHRNVELEARLIDDLLDLTRIERGKLQLNLETADANRLVGNVLDICSADITAKHLNVSVALDARSHSVRGDTARLQQVFWNLIKNAVKFTPEGGAIGVRTLNDESGSFVLQVSDSGIGIAGDILPRIFNAFEQGERTINHRFGGLGLGLAISRTLVDLHAGRIEAASDGEGRGATFTVVLPTILPDLPPGRGEQDPGGLHPIRVLLVEDHRDTREVMRMFLEQRGYQVRVAHSLESALREAAMPFDLLISDIGLPDGSGLDLMRELSARGPVAGLAVSGYGMEEDIRRSIEAGFAEHLTKPVKPARLEEAIRALVRR